MAVDRLTTREESVRALVVAGSGTDEVAARLGISRRTVETHLRNVYKKLGVHRREELGGERPAVPPRTAGPDEVRALAERLAVRDRQVRTYEAAVRRIVERQFPLFDERVEITVTIGANGQEDVVTERHRTVPKPYLVYRVVRPIAGHPTVPGTVESLAMTCEVQGADVGVAVQLVPDEHDRPRALVLFQPGLREPADWVLRYRTPGLWDPLRADGVDRLSWATGTLDEPHADRIDELTVHFVFPPGAAATEVTERRGAGRVERAADGHLVYVDRTRTGGVYDWQLRMGPRVRRPG